MVLINGTILNTNMNLEDWLGSGMEGLAFTRKTQGAGVLSPV